MLSPTSTNDVGTRWKIECAAVEAISEANKVVSASILICGESGDVHKFIGRVKENHEVVMRKNVPGRHLRTTFTTPEGDQQIDLDKFQVPGFVEAEAPLPLTPKVRYSPLPSVTDQNANYS